MQDDFRPYVYETTDLGRHWKAITAGLPADEFVFDIRQDPNDPALLFLGTRSTVYMSLDSGAHWQPLTLNLPVTEVRDLAINPRQGEVVAATHGRAFWILDNLTVLEQLTKNPDVSSNAAFLFAPQKAWLTYAYGVPSPERRRPPDAGDNSPFGATIFFHIPQNYDGKTPATLEVTGPQGKVVQSFALHLETAKEKKEKEKEKEVQAGETEPAKGQENAAEVDHSAEPTDQQIREKQERLTAIEPGMNRFQWDLRYPYAAEVAGYHAPIPAGGLKDSVEGPEVLPGNYTVVLNYGGQKSQAGLVVGLDPRLHATQQELAARLELDQRIHADLDTLDKDIDQALEERNRMQNAVARHALTDTQAVSAVAALNREIDSVAQMEMKSSEGSLLYETKLRDHLAYLAADIDLAYTRPTPAQYAVFQVLDQRAKAAEQRLQTAVAEADKLNAANATRGTHPAQR
jgi:hypothetical protein